MALFIIIYRGSWVHAASLIIIIIIIIIIVKERLDKNSTVAVRKSLPITMF